MASDTRKDSSSALFLIGSIIFLVLGLWSSPLFFAGAVALLGLVLAQKPAHRRFSWVVLAAAAIFFMVVLGLGIGKDMAVRDNARDAMSASGAKLGD